MEMEPTIDEIVEKLVEFGDEFNLFLQSNSQLPRLPPPVRFALMNVLIISLKLTTSFML